MSNIRNFCVIAHIDHGKSTLADRILEVTHFTGQVQIAQVLDGMDLERERGITIKASPIRIPYTAADGQVYTLNLIDTPGHVDFSYEVSRSIRACEGAVLLVDASQGVEAQTIANAYRAIEAGLEIIPVINKIDLPNALVDECAMQIEELLGLPGDEALLISAKSGAGVPELLEAIVSRVPPPRADPNGPLACLVFDSNYDPYRGVIAHVRLFSGSVAPGDQVMIASTGKVVEVQEVGYFGLQLMPGKALAAGDVGYISCLIRHVTDLHVGDSFVTPGAGGEALAVPGFRRFQPAVYCGLYPIDTTDYDKLRVALEKLQLNDSSIVYEKESSAALGHGFRTGFLGTLHMEIAIERLRREYDQELIATMPSVVYRVTTRDGRQDSIENPSRFPDPANIDHIEEPIVRAQIMVQTRFVGPCMELASGKRGALVKMEHPDERRVVLTYDLPLAEIITDFHDRLKSVSKGYASMDYELNGYRQSDLVKVDILINGDPVDALSYIALRSNAASKGRALIHRLRGLIPRQQFKVPLQAAIGSTVVAREDIAPMRKDVTAKCYGGDVTRKRKLLERQKEGKKRLKMIGAVEVPQEAFFSLLKLEEEA